MVAVMVQSNLWEMFHIARVVLRPNKRGLLTSIGPPSKRDVLSSQGLLVHQQHGPFWSDLGCFGSNFSGGLLTSLSAFSQAMAMGMMTEYYHFIFTTLVMYLDSFISLAFHKLSVITLSLWGSQPNQGQKEEDVLERQRNEDCAHNIFVNEFRHSKNKCAEVDLGFRFISGQQSKLKYWIYSPWTSQTQFLGCIFELTILSLCVTIYCIGKKEI